MGRTLGTGRDADLVGLRSGSSVYTPIGERIAVRPGCGFRRPTHQQRTLLAPVWRGALVRCGMSAGDLDLYVQRGREPTAYAVGRRGVAVTSGAVEEFRACRMGREYLEAILCHDLLTAPVTDVPEMPAA